MLKMENSEEVMQILERFTRLKQKEIPKELDDYLQYVAKTGDTVFKWSSLKYLFREKLLNVIKQFHESSSRVDEIPQYPNVDPFNYESMKSALLERLELFSAAPFTIQRLCELLIEPRKQYSRIDKFMRALEKNILVVSTVEPGQKRTESENGDSLDSAVNGDASMDVNVDTDMEKDSPATAHAASAEVQNGNGTAAITEEEEPVRSDKAVEKSPAKDPTTNAVRSGDDDVLPNPKKAKLDFNKAQDEKPKEASMEVEVEAEVAKDKEEKEETKVVEVKQTEKDIKIASSNVVGVVFEAEDTAKEVKENGKTDNNDIVDKAAVEEKEAKSSVGVTVEVNKEEKSEILAEPVKKMEVDGADSEKNTAVESTENEVKEETAKTADKKDDEKKTVEEEKIVEKQDIEKDEKKEASTTKEDPKAAKQEPKTSEKAKELKTVVEKFEAAPKEDKVTEAETKATKIESIGEKIEAKEEKSEIKEAKTEAKEAKPVDKEVKAEVEEAKPEAKKGATVDNVAEAVVDVEKPAITEVEKKPVEMAKDAVVVDSTSETKPEVKEQKAEPKAAEETKAPAAADNKTEAEAVEVDSSTEAISSSSNTESAAEKKTKIAEKVDEKADDAVIPVVSTAAETTPEVNAAELESPVTPIEADTSPVEADACLPIVASIEVDTPVVAEAATAKTEHVTPILALNDQPMEETPGEAESTTSEEVIMAELGAGTTEMATDAIEPAKEEPAGMEVDDTSQEAMDQ